MKDSPKQSLLIIIALFQIFLYSCDTSITNRSSINGMAFNSAVKDATVRTYYFDGNGVEHQIFPLNNPVLTEADGSYNFHCCVTGLSGISSPLLVRSIGGSMGGAPAPRLEALIVNPMLLSISDNSLTTHLSFASSVAAGLVKKYARLTGTSPTTIDAERFIALVEVELLEGNHLYEDPSDPANSVAQLNFAIDCNLNTFCTPDNNKAIDELIEYYIANLSSSSAVLDDKMDDPDNPGTDIPADFSNFGSGELAILFPGGPNDLRYMSISTNTTSIGSDGLSNAVLSINLSDATGAPVPDETMISIACVYGQCILSDSTLTTTNGQAQTSLTSDVAGSTIVEASSSLSNGSSLSRRVKVDVKTCDQVDAISAFSDLTKIVDDGVYAATITAVLSASCQNSKVPDGKQVAFEIIEGEAILSANSATTTNGQAKVTLTSTKLGTVSIRVSAIDDLSNSHTDTVSLNVVELVGQVVPLERHSLISAETRSSGLIFSHDEDSMQTLLTDFDPFTGNLTVRSYSPPIGGVFMYYNSGVASAAQESKLAFGNENQLISVSGSGSASVEVGTNSHAYAESKMELLMQVVEAPVEFDLNGSIYTNYNHACSINCCTSLGRVSLKPQDGDPIFNIDLAGMGYLYDISQIHTLPVGIYRFSMLVEAECTTFGGSVIAPAPYFDFKLRMN